MAGSARPAFTMHDRATRIASFQVIGTLENLTPTLLF